MGQKYYGGRPLGDYCLLARAAAQPERGDCRCIAGTPGGTGEKMSDRPQALPTPEGEYFESNRFAGLSVLVGLIAFVALTLSIAGAMIDPHQFSFSWLFAFGFFFPLCAGCFFWTIVHYATDADWTVVVRRQLENLAVLFGVLALFFIPIFLLRHHLYEWMDIPPG